MKVGLLRKIKHPLLNAVVLKFRTKCHKAFELYLMLRYHLRIFAKAFPNTLYSDLNSLLYIYTSCENSSTIQRFFLFDEPLKGSKSLKIFKISLTFRFDKLWHLSRSVHTGENSQILTVSNKKVLA
jgi:hypothetical protein